VLYSFFKTLSWTYAEAGFIDGASHAKVFFRIMLPQALPVIGSLFMVQVVQLWNDYMEPNLFLQSYPTLSSGLYIFQLEMTRGINYPVLFAGLIISVIPVIILFVCFQNTMMESMSVGGIKG
ncbi:MAG: ABC transporter permease subunit, partial [Clostridiales bacterium]|nr:ABC transporter permease subunit [Clostridiales bacterium]